MKKKIKEHHHEFELMFKDFIKEKGVEFIGCQANKQYSKAYRALITELEKTLLQEKRDAVKDQNYVYYNKKCKDLIDQAENDSFCKAAANLMLNSELDCLDDLRKEYKDKLGGTDLFLQEAKDEELEPVQETK